MKTRNYISIIVLSFVAVMVFIFCYNFQISLDYENCPKCDGNDYLNIYNYFTNNTPTYNVDYPFNTRILVPFLASISTFSNPLLNFHFVNIIFLILSLSTIYILWTELKISRTLKLIGFFWLIFHWIGIIRQNIHDTINVDVPLYFFHALLLLIVYRKKYNWLPLLAIIATSQKESFPAYLIVLLIYAIFHNKFYESYFNLKPILISIIAAFITKYIINYFFPATGESYNSFISVLFYIKQILVNPELIIIWIVAIFTSYGAFLFASFNSKNTIESTPENNILFVFAVVSILLSIIAGGDFTRISFLGFPFIMSWILLRINSSSVLEIAITVLLSIPVMRLFSAIPEPIYAPVVTHHWFMEFSPNHIVAFWGIYMIICYLILQRVSKAVQ